MEQKLERGAGQGVGGDRQGDGGAAKCVCPRCSYTIAHPRGIPCSSKLCPKCNVPLVGK